MFIILLSFVVSTICFVNRRLLLSKHWVQLFRDVALFAVNLLLANFHHHIGICLSIWVCGSQIGCLSVHKGKKVQIQTNAQKISMKMENMVTFILMVP